MGAYNDSSGVGRLIFASEHVARQTSFAATFWPACRRAGPSRRVVYFWRADPGHFSRAPKFPDRARKLLDAARPFRFDVTGESLRQLEPFLKDGRVDDPGRLVTTPKLQALAGVVTFAGVNNRRVDFEECSGVLKVRVG